MKDYVDQYDTENDDADIDVNLSVKFDNLVVFLFHERSPAFVYHSIIFSGERQCCHGIHNRKKFVPYYPKRRYTMKALDYTLLTLVIIGAVNWGLIGFFQFDLVAFIFGNMSWISRIVHALVGLSGLYMLSAYGRLKSS